MMRVFCEVPGFDEFHFLGQKFQLTHFSEGIAHPSGHLWGKREGEQRGEGMGWPVAEGKE